MSMGHQSELTRSYIEQTLLDQAVDSVVFEDLAPTTSSRRVGASAFVSGLSSVRAVAEK